MMSKKTYKLIIFDLDGTIADTSPGILNSIRYTQKIMNLPQISEEKMYSHVGPPIAESYKRSFGLCGEALNKAVFYHVSYGQAKGYKELKIYDGIAKVLECLRQSKKKIAVATLKAQETANKIFENMGLKGEIDLLIGMRENEKLTKAQMIELIIKGLKCTKKQSVLVGDSIYDAIGAEQAGIDFIAVTYGFGFKTEKELCKINHIAVCKEPIELLKVLN